MSNCKLIIAHMLVIISIYSNCIALDVATHRELNAGISNRTFNEFNLSDCLEQNLKISAGVEAEFNNATVWELIRDGGRYEDKPPWTFPYVRSFNHFHNPLESLAEAGYGTGDSAVLWSQKAVGTQSPGGYYSWHDVRDYYLKALRSSDKMTRDENFAETFRGLGQLMHLVQDMSVPEHARDDGHVMPAYEEWVAKAPAGIALTASALANPIPFDISILRQPSPFSETNVEIPIARLFDSEQYQGIDPDPEVTITPDIGLAEYTSANFVSGDTIFQQAFPYPKESSTIRVDCDFAHPFEPATPLKRPYYIKIADGQTGGGSLCADGQVAAGYRLAGVDYLYFYRQQEELPPELELIIVPMDDYVFADYARLLLPRAVGYSATLLHYFFRGQIDITPVEGSPGSYVIHNNSDEEMNGDFELYFDGKSPYENFRSQIASFNLAVPARGTSEPVTFSMPNSARAVEPGKFILVFKGDWGEEKEVAVAGRAVTLPLVGWIEEWDNELTGNHPWLTTDIELNGINPPNGQTFNLVSGGKLIKENIRYAGSNVGRVNQTVIMDAFQSPTGTYCIDEYFSHCVPHDFGVDFPLAIMPSTWVNVKLDELSVNASIPYQSCGTTSGPGEYQGILMKIRDQSGDLNLFFTRYDGQLPPSNGPLWTSRVTPGQDMSFNIFSAFSQAGRPLVAPVNLLSINIVQALGNLCSPSAIEHQQRLVVDHIRLEN